MKKNQREIRRLAENQLSSDADLPRPQRYKDKNGIVREVYEIPVDPSYFEQRSNYVLPPEERVYVEGRSWTISRF